MTSKPTFVEAFAEALPTTFNRSRCRTHIEGAMSDTSWNLRVVHGGDRLFEIRIPRPSIGDLLGGSGFEWNSDDVLHFHRDPTRVLRHAWRDVAQVRVPLSSFDEDSGPSILGAGHRRYLGLDDRTKDALLSHVEQRFTSGDLGVTSPDGVVIGTPWVLRGDSDISHGNARLILDRLWTTDPPEDGAAIVSAWD